LADQLRERILRLSPEERIAAALALVRRAAELYAAGRCNDSRTAVRVLRESRRRARRPSRAAEPSDT
jgi:hypothetical protein